MKMYTTLGCGKMWQNNQECDDEKENNQENIGWLDGCMYELACFQTVWILTTANGFSK